MCEIEEIDWRLYKFQDDFARTLFYWWDSQPILLKDVTLRIKFLYHLCLECRSKVFWKISKLQIRCNGIRRFSFGCIIRNVKQHVFAKNDSQCCFMFDWLIYTVEKFYDTIKISTCWSSIFMIYPTKRMIKRTYEKKFLFNFLFANQSLTSRVFPYLMLIKIQRCKWRCISSFEFVSTFQWISLFPN